MIFLVFGSNGWIGNMVVRLLEQHGHEVRIPTCRADNDERVEQELDRVKPDRVICLIGRTHGPGSSTIDYLEQPGKLVENVRDNLFAPFVLASACKAKSIHMTYMGTGCIFDGYKNGQGFCEEDEPNFFGSSYSVVKGFTDRMMHSFHDNVLNLRLRMPISNDDSPRNFITKIMTYKRICSMENSMSVLPELLPLMIDMACEGVTGTMNFTNPGTITHNEILEMVKEIYDPEFTWENFSLEEQAHVLKSQRSNNKLDTSRLESLYVVTPIREAVRKVIVEMSQKQK